MCHVLYVNKIDIKVSRLQYLKRREDDVAGEDRGEPVEIRVPLWKAPTFEPGMNDALNKPGGDSIRVE